MLELGKAIYPGSQYPNLSQPYNELPICIYGTVTDPLNYRISPPFTASHVR